ncbi:MAG: hypothetical protein WC749_11925 [Dehalococcoidia bacterium]
MKKVTTFEEVLEAADRLSLEEQEAITDILRRRVIDERRKELVNEVHEARKEYQEGRCHEASSEQILKEILS